MKFRPIAGAFSAMLLLSSAAHAAGEADTLRAFGQAFMDARQPSPKIRVPGPRNERVEVRPIQLAQAGDPRVVQLEEQIRQLNGLVEELNFQVLQMQEQLRKMQEDNEFRFQQLEGSGDGIAEQAPQKRSDANGIETVIETPQGSIAQAPTATPPAGATLPSITPPPAGSAATGQPARPLGQITFDANGNPRQVQPEGLPGVQTGPGVTDNTQVAALPSTDDPDELYRNSYEFMLSGDYATAEAGFRQHGERFPADARAADSRFWLGESLLAQRRYREAAQIFLTASKEYPKAKKAPDMMLKLGVSLAAMEQRDVACATLAEVARRYPDAPQQIKVRVKDEQQRAAC